MERLSKNQAASIVVLIFILHEILTHDNSGFISGVR